MPITPSDPLTTVSSLNSNVDYKDRITVSSEQDALKTPLVTLGDTHNTSVVSSPMSLAVANIVPNQKIEELYNVKGENDDRRYPYHLSFQESTIISKKKLENWKILLIFSSILLCLISISIPLSLDNYIPRIIPDIEIIILFTSYFFLIYNNYVDGPQTSRSIAVLFEKLEIDITNKSKRRFLFLLSIAISATPTYILTHGYSTSGPPAFFPGSIFPLTVITGILLIILWNGFLKAHIEFQLCMWFFIIDMIISASVPSMPESKLVLILRSIYTVILLIVSLYLLIHFIDSFREIRSRNNADPMLSRVPSTSKSPRIRVLIFSIILLIIFGVNTISLIGSYSWLWDNYLPPGIERFPSVLHVGADEAIYLPIVTREEYRYNLLPVGSNPFLVHVDFNKTRCSEYLPFVNDEFGTPGSLWITNQNCDPVSVALQAQSLEYSIVIFTQLQDLSNYTTIIVNEHLSIPILAMKSSLLSNNLEINDGLDISNPIYTVVTREFIELWSYPRSYMIQCLPIILGLCIIASILIYSLINDKI